MLFALCTGLVCADVFAQAKSLIDKDGRVNIWQGKTSWQMQGFDLPADVQAKVKAADQVVVSLHMDLFEKWVIGHCHEIRECFARLAAQTPDTHFVVIITMQPNEAPLEQAKQLTRSVRARGKVEDPEQDPIQKRKNMLATNKFLMTIGDVAEIEPAYDRVSLVITHTPNDDRYGEFTKDFGETGGVPRYLVCGADGKVRYATSKAGNYGMWQLYDHLTRPDAYRARALKGDADAMYRLGKAYLIGRGVKQNPELGFDWTRRAAEAGSTKGMVNMGYCYTQGVGVSVDYAKANAWHRKAREAGEPIAEVNLGIAQVYAMGFAKDVESGIARVRKVAEAGNTVAMVSLAGVYANGQAVAKDLERSFRWALQAAELGHAAAMYHVGICYHNGQGVEKSLANAANWYLHAANAGHADGAYWTGRFYQSGTEYKKDAEQASDYFLRAAEAGHLHAAYEIANCYFLGLGVDVDHKQSFRWNLKAAEAGHKGAMIRLARCYEQGIGVEKDEQAAAQWRTKAKVEDAP